MKTFIYVQLIFIFPLNLFASGLKASLQNEAETIRQALIQSDGVEMVEFFEDGTNKTFLVAPFLFYFEANNTVTAISATTTIEGTFDIFRDDNRTELAMSFPAGSALAELTDDWYFISQTGNRLRFQDEEDYIILEINPGPPTSTGKDEVVSGFSLAQNYPNPFNPTTNISFSIPEATEVRLEVFNMQGQHVATLANGSFAAGSHLLSFDAGAFSSGIYLYRITAGNFTQTKKMMLVK